jgi:hypothetical protein
MFTVGHAAKDRTTFDPTGGVWARGSSYVCVIVRPSRVSSAVTVLLSIFELTNIASS